MPANNLEVSFKNAFFFSVARKGTEFFVFNSIFDGLKQYFNSRVSYGFFDFFKIRNILFFLRARYVFFHSPLSVSFPVSIFSILFRKKIIVFIWDYYPVTLSGATYSPSIKRFFKDFIEKIFIFFSDLILVPSKDFVPYYLDGNVFSVPFWAHLDDIKKRISIDAHKSLQKSCVMSFIFAGQINDTRGLSDFIEYLLCKIDCPFEFRIASADEIPSDLKRYDFIKYLGFMSKEQLLREYSECHFGVICLSKDFDGPAFPSKTFDYLSASLPCVYYGPHLSDFIGKIECSGVGIILSDCPRINLDFYKSAFVDFDNKREYFYSMTCLSSGSLLKILNLIKSMD